MSCNCTNDPNSFYYVCGEIVPKDTQRNITVLIKVAYAQYFEIKLGDQDKYWAPHVCCRRCATALLSFVKDRKKRMPFTVPMIWREPTHHTTDCYFCLSNISGCKRKGKRKISYPNVPSAIRPVREDEIHEPPMISTLEVLDTSASTSDDATSESLKNEEIHLITQGELNDLVRDLNLTKEKAEILGSRLQQWNLLEQGTTISHFRKRSETLKKYFSASGNLCYCSNVRVIIYRIKISTSA